MTKIDLVQPIRARNVTTILARQTIRDCRLPVYNVVYVNINAMCGIIVRLTKTRAALITDE